MSVTLLNQSSDMLRLIIEWIGPIDSNLCTWLPFICKQMQKILLLFYPRIHFDFVSGSIDKEAQINPNYIHKLRIKNLESLEHITTLPNLCNLRIYNATNCDFSSMTRLKKLDVVGTLLQGHLFPSNLVKLNIRWAGSSSFGNYILDWHTLDLQHCVNLISCCLQMLYQDRPIQFMLPFQLKHLRLFCISQKFKCFCTNLESLDVTANDLSSILAAFDNPKVTSVTIRHYSNLIDSIHEKPWEYVTHLTFFGGLHADTIYLFPNVTSLFISYHDFSLEYIHKLCFPKLKYLSIQWHFNFAVSFAKTMFEILFSKLPYLSQIELSLSFTCEDFSRFYVLKDITHHIEFSPCNIILWNVKKT